MTAPVPRKLVLRHIKGGWYVYRKYYVGKSGRGKPTYKHEYRGKFPRTRTTRPTYAEMEFVESLYLADHPKREPRK